MKMMMVCLSVLLLAACGDEGGDFEASGADVGGAGDLDVGDSEPEPEATPDAAQEEDIGQTPDEDVPEMAEPDATPVDPEQTFPVGEFVETVSDDARDRPITYKVYFPEGFEGDAALVLVSHGGQGSAVGHNSLGHLGSHYAERGYVAIHIGHRRSDSNLGHRRDRPADVSFMLDMIEAGELPLPEAFGGSIDMDRVGHVGHSWGAYTAHAVGGGRFDQGSFRDGRIKAICPLSPQGPGGFGAFDNGEDDNSWGEMDVPAFNILGSVEKNGPVGNFDMMEDWRLQPFLRYPQVSDKYLAVLPGQNHGDIGSGGSEEVKAYIATNTRIFLDVYVRGLESLVCDIGQVGIVPSVDFRQKFDPEVGLPRDCP